MNTFEFLFCMVVTFVNGWALCSISKRNDRPRVRWEPKTKQVIRGENAEGKPHMTEVTVYTPNKFPLDFEVDDLPPDPPTDWDQEFKKLR